MERFMSNDYRKLLEEKKIELSDWDKASVIHHYAAASFDEKKTALEELCEQTSDMELKEQIRGYLAQKADHLKQFPVNSGNSYYRLESWYDGKYMGYEIYLDYDSARKDGMDEKIPFKITKEHLAGTETKGEILGSIYFDAHGNAESIWSYRTGGEGEIDEKAQKHFKERYVDLPLFFRMGDIVHIVGTEQYGIVADLKDDEEEKKRCNFGRMSDTYECLQVTVDLYYEGKRYLPIFEHQHVHPTELEFAKFEEGDSRKGFLEYIQNRVYHNYLFYRNQEMGRIKEVLDKLKTVWYEYPTYSLGQLLLTVCGSYDLFAIEDEKLLEQLENNIW